VRLDHLLSKERPDRPVGVVEGPATDVGFVGVLIGGDTGLVAVWVAVWSGTACFPCVGGWVWRGWVAVWVVVVSALLGPEGTGSHLVCGVGFLGLCLLRQTALAAGVVVGVCVVVWVRLVVC
jgi:hypothetical protein